MLTRRTSIAAAAKLAVLTSIGIVMVAASPLTSFPAETEPATRSVGNLENKVKQLTDEIGSLKAELWKAESLLEAIQCENAILQEAPLPPESDFADLDEAARALVWETVQTALAERNQRLWDGEREQLVSDYHTCERETLALAGSTRQRLNGSAGVLQSAASFYQSMPDAEPSVVEMLFSRKFLGSWVACLGLTLVAVVVVLHDRLLALRKILRPRANRLRTEHRAPASKVATAGILVAVALVTASCSRQFDLAACDERCREELERQVRSLEEHRTVLADTLMAEKAKLEKAEEENHSLFEKHVDAWTKHVAGNSTDSETIRKKLRDSEAVAQGRVRELAVSAAVARQAQEEASANLSGIEKTVNQVEAFRLAKENEDARAATARVSLFGGFGLLNILLISFWFVRRESEKRRTYNTCPQCLSLENLQVTNNPSPDERNPERNVVTCSECKYQMRPLYRKMQRVCLPTVGYTSSGKTLWLSMFHQSVRFGRANTGLARLERASSLGYSDMEAGHSDLDFDNVLAKVLEHHAPGATVPTPENIPCPLVFHFSDGERLAPNGGLVNIFDFAGSTMFRRLEGTKLQQRALSMDGFLYFLDPTGSFPPEGRHAPAVDTAIATPERQNEVLRHFREQLRLARDIPVGQPVKLPVAICITKTDLLSKIARPGRDAFCAFVSELQKIGSGQRGPTLDAIRGRHELFLSRRELFFPGWNIEEQFDELFAGGFMFFPLTSVGFDKDELGEEDLTRRTYKPFGIIEPVLWLLHMNGFKVLR